MGVGSQRHFPAALPSGMTRYSFFRRLGRPRAGLDVCGISRPNRRDSKPQSQQASGRRRLPQTARPLQSAFDPRTFQPAVSRYTDWAIPTQICNRILRDKCYLLFHHRNSDINGGPSLVTTLWNGPNSQISVPGTSSDFCLQHRVHTSSGFHPASRPIETGS